MRIDLITLIADDVPKMAAFYRDVMGFPIKVDMGGYVEFASDGARFAVCTRATMYEATQHVSYKDPKSGQRIELAFPLNTPDEVDRIYQTIVAKGATPVSPPADMPWGQRAAFFADPEGNIHELFAELSQPNV